MAVVQASSNALLRPCARAPLQVLEEVASSRSALQLLLDGQDYAGALDLLEVRGSAAGGGGLEISEGRPGGVGLRGSIRRKGGLTALPG